MIARYMQTKAPAAGERKRWAIDTENVGRTFARRRAIRA